MKVVDDFYNFFDTYGDPRLKEWFLMSSPLPTICIFLSYVLFVTKIGPWLMKNREPFNLRKTLICYNFVQVLVSAYLFYEACVCGWSTFHIRDIFCQPVDFSNSPLALRTMLGCYLYYLSKFFEFFDTIFFVLRKNNHQITALHVFHHSMMPPAVWIGVKFTPGGHLCIFGFLNTFVHIFMYSYYLTAALGPQYKKYLWWKEYLTILQMIHVTVLRVAKSISLNRWNSMLLQRSRRNEPVLAQPADRDLTWKTERLYMFLWKALQFLAVVIHTTPSLFVECNSPKVLVYLELGFAIVFFGLFYNFYDRCYVKGKKQSKLGLKINAFARMCFPGQRVLLEDESKHE